MIPLTLRITIEHLRKTVLNTIHEDILLFFGSEEYFDLDFVVVHRAISEKIPPDYREKFDLWNKENKIQLTFNII
jgi:hypothetical protein